MTCIPSRRAFVLTLALMICVAASARAQTLALVFSDSMAVNVDASRLEIRNEDASPKTYPYVTDRSPVTYEQAVKSWASQRFTLTGKTVNTLRITLRRATITEKLLPTTKGIAGWFKKEQSAEYTGAVELEIAIVDPNNRVLTTVNGKSWAAETMREDATTSDRENTWLQLVKKTFDNLDADVVPRMRETMVSYVR